MKKLLFILVVPFALTACASNSNPPGPEGTGDHKQGYYLGRSDAAKQQYWMIQNLQHREDAPASNPTTYVPVTVGGTSANGVTTVSHTELIRVEEPNSP